MIGRLNHVAIAVRDIAAASRMYRSTLGAEVSAPEALPERRKLAFAGIVTVAVAIDERGEIVGDPVVDAMGLPEKNRDGRDLTDIIADAVADLLDGLPKAKRRDPDTVENALHRAVRAAVNQEWGKKPACHVMVIEV